MSTDMTTTTRFPESPEPVAGMRDSGVWLPVRDSEGGHWWPVSDRPGQYVKSENSPIGISWVALDLELTVVHETVIGWQSEDEISALFLWAEPNACRYCHRSAGEHGIREHDGMHVTGGGEYVAPSDALRLRRMRARRAERTTAAIERAARRIAALTSAADLDVKREPWPWNPDTDPNSYGRRVVEAMALDARRWD